MAEDFVRHIGQGFIDWCKAEHHVVVCSEIVEMEFGRKQQEKIDSKKSELSEAVALLRGHNKEVDISDIEFVALSLQEFFQSSGVAYESPKATEEIYDCAVRRCANHLAPVVKSGKADQTCDVIIFLQALGDAASGKPTMIISNDEVHYNETAVEEANISGCGVVRSIGMAVASGTSLGPYTDFLTDNWKDIVANSHVGLPQELVFHGISSFSFQRRGGNELVFITGKLAKEHGGNLVSGEHSFEIRDDGVELSLLAIRDSSGMNMLKEPPEIELKAMENYEKDLREMRQIIGVKASADHNRE